MNRPNTHKPIVPYMMNSPYAGYGRYRGHMNVVNNGNPTYYGGAGYHRYYNLPLNKETNTDAVKTQQMYGNRNKRYSVYLRRWETQLSDVGMVTVERHNKKVRKYVHTPYVMTERYITEFELAMLKWRIIGIVSLSAIVIAVVTILLVILL